MNINHKNVDLDCQYNDILKNVVFKPIFILGVQRSGTSILYKLLSETGAFNIVTAYHIINNKEIVYNHINKKEEKSKKDLDVFFKNLSQNDRKIDKLKITPDFPEEYGFLLSKETNNSKLTSESIDIFIRFCKKIQLISENDKPLLLKNPFDFKNFIYLSSIFPEAKFIFIHRNPVKTLNSQLRAMRILLKQKSEYMSILSPGYSKIFKNKILLEYYRFLYSSITPLRVNNAIKNLVFSTDYFLNNIKYLDDKKFMNTRYEDICDKSNDEIKKIMNFLDIAINFNIDFAYEVKPRSIDLLKEIKDREKQIQKRMESYLKYFNYS